VPTAAREWKAPDRMSVKKKKKVYRFCHILDCKKTKLTDMVEFGRELVIGH
jgi:hypothetical protein